MDANNNKILGRPLNHTPLAFLKFHNEDETDDYYKVVRESKKKLKRVFLFTKNADNTCVNNQCNSNCSASELDTQNSSISSGNISQNMQPPIPPQFVHSNPLVQSVQLEMPARSIQMQLPSQPFQSEVQLQAVQPEISAQNIQQVLIAQNIDEISAVNSSGISSCQEINGSNENAAEQTISNEITEENTDNSLDLFHFDDDLDFGCRIDFDDNDAFSTLKTDDYIF